MRQPARCFALLTAVAALPLSSCATVGDLPTERVASARLSLPNGIPAGTVQLLGSGNELTLAVAVTGLEQGAHGFHLHTTGQCAAPDFTSAGGHLNPEGNTHGSLSPGGSHFGDLPNLMVGANGSASATIELDGASRAQMIDWLFDSDGTAVIVHAGPDDYLSDPAGDAGARVACGVLQRS